jgi:hypothetical protein
MIKSLIITKKSQKNKNNIKQLIKKSKIPILTLLILKHLRISKYNHIKRPVSNQDRIQMHM